MYNIYNRAVWYAVKYLYNCLPDMGLLCISNAVNILLMDDEKGAGDLRVF